MNRKKFLWLFAGLVIIAGLVIWISGEESKPIPETLEPGLLVRFEDARSQRTDTRTARLLSLYVQAGESPTPFLEPGPFKTTWQGWLEIKVDDEYSFRFEGTGHIEMRVGDRTILSGDSQTESNPVHLSEGKHNLSVKYTSPQSGPAQMRVFWSASHFGSEPIPPFLLSHDGTNETLQHSDRLRHGRMLVAEYSCLNCHQPEDPSDFDLTSMPELTMDAPDLADIGSRLHTSWMQRWIENPQSIRPSAKMPNMGLNKQEAADIAAYLATLGESPDVKENDRPSSSQISEGGRLFATQGCVACHTFDHNAEDAERLNLANSAGKWYPSALVEYLQEPAKHQKWTAMPDFHLSEQEATAIAAFLLEQGEPSNDNLVDGNPHHGKILIQQSGCVSCHSAPVENLFEASSLEKLMLANWQEGWLSGQKTGLAIVPHPELDPSDREAILAFASKGFESLQRYSPVEFASRQVRRLDCRACHKLDGQGDRWSELAEETDYLLSEFGDDPIAFAQRRPDLTWMGEKLQPEWLEKVLAGRQENAARPWMMARMPSIGTNPSLMARGLLATHGLDNQFEHIQPNPELISEGRRFARGLGNGFFCQSCHHGGAGGGFPAPALEMLGERLQPEFYHRKMLKPRRIDPQTAMPAFADAEGRTRYLDRFEGDAQKQFEAIWHYLVNIRVGREIDPDEEPVETDIRWVELYQQMDTGPVYSGVIDVPDPDQGELEINPVLGYVTNVPTDGHRDKGLSIRVGDHQQASVHFDHDLLRMSAAWTGGFLEFRSNHDQGVRNVPPPAVAGEVRFTSPEVAGWTDINNPFFTDTRNQPAGPMPEDHGRYEGLYLHGDRAVISYTVFGTSIYESPWYVENGQTGAFIRDFMIGNHDRTLKVLLFEGEGKTEIETRGSLQYARVEQDGRIVAAAVDNANNVRLIDVSGGQVAIQFDPQTDRRSIRSLIWEGPSGELEDFLSLASEFSDPDDLNRLIEPGPSVWGEPLITRGEPGESAGPYTIDLIRAPLENPYNALFNFTGVDFLSDGRAVLTTMHGDVWLVDGIDESLERLTWQRFATGLNIPFGVRVVNDKIYVSNEDELTILHDRNGNGEADYYENFRNLIAPGGGAWRQAFGLEVDAEGNFYFARGRGAASTDQNEGIFRISADGSEIEMIASGFRQPWGMSISPHGHITVSQQEGPWVPQTPVNIIDLENRKGSFYGHQPDRFRREDPYPREIGYEPPIVWMPRHVDNSGAGQIWIESDHWGLPRNQMLHLSYGQGSLLQLMHEQVDGEWQGGVVKMVQFNELRPRTGRFRSQDGQLYVVGLNTDGFKRVYHTGEKVHLPVSLHAHENGIRIRFNHPLKASSANDISSYTIHQWNYRWTNEYGSGFYSVKNPDLFGEDPVDVVSVTLLGSGQEIFLEIPNMVPVNQMRISYDLEAADGTSLHEDIYNTIHALSPPFEP